MKKLDIDEIALAAKTALGQDGRMDISIIWGRDMRRVMFVATPGDRLFEVDPTNQKGPDGSRILDLCVTFALQREPCSPESLHLLTLIGNIIQTMDRSSCEN